jgi:hypothetical protein
MSLPVAIRHLVRERAGFACEYCGVTEGDVGGELTIDHYHPRSLGGSDHPDNLLYSCPRCNGYKADYFSTHIEDPRLWNPRREPFAEHFLVLGNGFLQPRTDVGRFTLQRLRLNRPQLIASRLRRREREEQERLLEYYRDLVVILERLYQQQGALLAEQHALLEEYRSLLALLLESER